MYPIAGRQRRPAIAFSADGGKCERAPQAHAFSGAAIGGTINAISSACNAG